MRVLEQCQHRMACARCDFYTPKDSSKGQLLEAKENLQKMLAGIPLTDDERAAVDEGQAASTSCWNGSPTSPPPPDRRHGRSEFPPPRRCCRSLTFATASLESAERRDPLKIRRLGGSM